MCVRDVCVCDNSAGARLPEYVDPVLLSRLDTLRSEFAHTARVPSNNRARFVSTFTAADAKSVAVLVGGVRCKTPNGTRMR